MICRRWILRHAYELIDRSLYRPWIRFCCTYKREARDLCGDQGIAVDVGLLGDATGLGDLRLGASLWASPTLPGFLFWFVPQLVMSAAIKEQTTARKRIDSLICLLRISTPSYDGRFRTRRTGCKYCRHTANWGGRGTNAPYLCKGDYDDGGQYCIGFGGGLVDRRVGQELLQVIAPFGSGSQSAST